MKPAELIFLSVNALKLHLNPDQIQLEQEGHRLRATWNGHEFSFLLHLPGKNNPAGNREVSIPFDYAIRSPAKVASLICARLQFNKRVFARKCLIEPVSKKVAAQFLDQFHLMGSTSSAWNLSLSHNGKMLAVASFSKGRKMRRLAANERSYELIRFCTYPGYTISGGLSRLVTDFCARRKAAEIMTYVDRQFSDGRSFIKAGFRVHDFTEPKTFYIHKRTFVRLNAGTAPGDKKEYYSISDAGNIRMLFSCR